MRHASDERTRGEPGDSITARLGRDLWCGGPQLTSVARLNDWCCAVHRAQRHGLAVSHESAVETAGRAPHHACIYLNHSTVERLQHASSVTGGMGTRGTRGSPVRNHGVFVFFH